MERAIRLRYSYLCFIDGYCRAHGWLYCLACRSVCGRLGAFGGLGGYRLQESCMGFSMPRTVNWLGCAQPIALYDRPRSPPNIPSPCRQQVEPPFQQHVHRHYFEGSPDTAVTPQRPQNGGASLIQSWLAGIAQAIERRLPNANGSLRQAQYNFDIRHGRNGEWTAVQVPNISVGDLLDRLVKLFPSAPDHRKVYRVSQANGRDHAEHVERHALVASLVEQAQGRLRLELHGS